MKTKLYMYIPEIGERLTLEEDWNFVLFKERRNYGFFKKFGYDLLPHYAVSSDKHQKQLIPVKTHKKIYSILETVPRVNDYNVYMKNILSKIQEELPNLEDEMIPELSICLPKGTVIIPDRIYIKKGLSDYSSITFRVESHPEIKRFKGRFWVHLKDVNNICCSVDV